MSSPNPELPITEKPIERKGLHASLYILNWIFFSNATIIFNKWLIDSAGFRYPIILTTWHLIFATIATQILARTTSLLDSRKSIPVNGRFYIRTILPIGLLYSGSLVCSNLVYLYLSVAFIQMLKSVSPVAVLFVSWAWGVADPSLTKLVNIMFIVIGVAIASYGEVQFSLVGFLFQLAGTAFEAVRLVMIQVMLSGEGLKMDPLVGLYYYAPVCAIMNLFVAAASEIPKFQWEHLFETGFGILFANALLAFMLNIASVFLIGKTSGLVMTLTGILKNILLVIISVLIWKTEITLLQILGYSVALGGLVYYSIGYDQLSQGVQNAFSWTADVWSNPSSEGRMPRAARRSILIIGFFLATAFVAVMILHSYDIYDISNPLSKVPSLFSSS